MEQKTAEEIYNLLSKGIKIYVKGLNTEDNDVYKSNELLILSCFNKTLEIIEENIPIMQTLVKQQQEIAVDKALEVASEKAVIFLPHSHYHGTTNIDKQSILSLKPEILKELEKWQ